MGEDVMEMKLLDFKGVAIGDDLLTSIQLVPSEGGDLNAKAREVQAPQGKQVADSNGPPPGEELAPAPTPAPAKNTPPPAEKKKVETAPVANDGPKAAKKKETGTEPDEPL